jgi:hypothetical protein
MQKYTKNSQNSLPLNRIAKVFIFRDEDYLGWDCFNKTEIKIGNNEDADLFLDDLHQQGMEAIITFNNDQISLVDPENSEQIEVNAHPVQSCILRPFDFITIGPYTLKIKINRLSTGQQPTDSTGSEVVSESKSFSAQAQAQARDIQGSGSENIQIFLEEEKSDEPDSVQDQAEDIQDSDSEDVQNFLEEENDAEPDSIQDLAREIHDSGSEDIQIFLEEEKDDEIDFDPDQTQKIPISDFEENHILSEESISSNNEHEEVINIDDLNDIDELEIPEIQFGEYIDDPYGDDDEDDSEASFLLLEKVIEEYNDVEIPRQESAFVEVMKCRNSNILDIIFLEPSEKFYITLNSGKKFCLAANNQGKQCNFYFNESLSGNIYTDSNESVELQKVSDQPYVENEDSFVLSQLCLNNKPIEPPEADLGYQLPEQGTVIINDGCYEYLIRKTCQGKSPEITAPVPAKSFHLKNFLSSSGLHVFIIFFISSLFSFDNPPQRQLADSRFVKIEDQQLRKMVSPPPEKKPVKKKNDKISKPVEKKQKVKAKLKAKKKAKIKKKKSVKKPRRKKAVKRSAKTTKKNKKQTRVSSTQPAGTGSKAGKIGNKSGSKKGGKGNVNKPIKQAGVLGMLGDAIDFTPGVVMASVTNLDAVAAAPSSLKTGAFKVGGVAAKLGNSKIELPKAGIVATQGRTQVLRGGSPDGDDRIASLAIGSTGQRQVQSMVTATLDKNVNVNGGISREDVKKVIDQHIDEVTFCYESALVNDPSLMGKIVFEWKIMSMGDVGATRIKSSTINSNSIHACIKKAIKSWGFPAPSGGQEVIVSYPFIFDIVGF